VNGLASGCRSLGTRLLCAFMLVESARVTRGDPMRQKAGMVA